MSKAVLTDRPELSEAQLRAAEHMEPDARDIPEAPAENWRYARRFYKPRK
jgi:hypothetical protein